MICPCKGCTDRTLTCHGFCQRYKEWKAEHAAEMPNPADDPAYREIIDRRRRYAEPIPGLTL